MIKSDLERRLQIKAYELRMDVIDMIYHGGSGHPGGSLSSAEIVTVLYYGIMKIKPQQPNWKQRDRFILSKGHCAPIIYAALADKGYFAKDKLKTLRQLDSMLQGHPDLRKTPGIDMTSGSLGQGLSVGLGMALGARQLGADYNVYVLLSDGELQEGMVWEAAMASSHYKADNLVALVDNNNLQVDGPVNEVMNIEPLVDKWRSFGWETLVVDGHNISQLLTALNCKKSVMGKPVAIICKTTKGKGVSYMENVMEWHASPISAELREKAWNELTATIEQLRAQSI